MKISELRKMVREVLAEMETDELEEISVTGNVSGYNTPRAFKKTDGTDEDAEPDAAYIRRITTGTGYTQVNEAVKQGKRYGNWSVTQYDPIKYDDLGSVSGGSIKLVNQEDFTTLNIQHDNALRGGKWWVSTKGKRVQDTKPETVIQKAIKLNRTSTRLTSLVNEGWILNEAEGMIKNPETGRTIKISTALGYDKSHPAYKIAAKQGGDTQSTTTKPAASKVKGDDQPTTGKPATSYPKIKGAFTGYRGDVDKDVIRGFIGKMNPKEAKQYSSALDKSVKAIEHSSNQQRKVDRRIDDMIGQNSRIQSAWYRQDRRDRDSFSDTERNLFDEIRNGGAGHSTMQKLIKYSKKNPNSKLALSADEISKSEKLLAHSAHHAKIESSNYKAFGIDSNDDYADWKVKKLRDAVSSELNK